VEDIKAFAEIQACGTLAADGTIEPMAAEDQASALKSFMSRRAEVYKPQPASAQ
jgi:hypothetical protein